MAHPVPLLEPISPIISHSQVTVLCYVMAHTLNNVTQLQIISIPPWYHPRTIYPPVPSYQKTRPGKHPWFVGDFQFWSLLSNHSSAYIQFTITTLHQCIFNPSAGQNRTPNKAVGGERTLKTISTGSVCRSHSDLENISQALSSANYKNPQLSPIAVSVLSVLQSVLSSVSGLPFYLPTNLLSPPGFKSEATNSLEILFWNRPSLQVYLLWILIGQNTLQIKPRYVAREQRLQRQRQGNRRKFSAAAKEEKTAQKCLVAFI